MHPSGTLQRLAIFSAGTARSREVLRFNEVLVHKSTGLVRGNTVNPNKSAGTGPGSFNAMLVPHLSDEARKAVNEAFDAISTWRSETLRNSEKKQRASD